MIAVMLLAIFVGFPISFTLIFLGLVFGAWGFGPKLVVYLMTLQFNNVMLEQTLAAVPLFIFMGILMEQAGLMERLFRAVQLMLASTRGALYIAVLFVSTIFAAATGIVGASVTILGIMAAKTMNRSGYDVKLAAGTITAGGTLGILIPPSIMLVVMGPVLEVTGDRSLRRRHRPRHSARLPVHRLFPDPMLAEPGARPAAAGRGTPGDTRAIDVAGVHSPPSSFRWGCSSSRRHDRSCTTLSQVSAARRRTAAPAAGPGGLSPGVRSRLLRGLEEGAPLAADANRPFGFYVSEVWTEFYLGLVPPALLVAIRARLDPARLGDADRRARPAAHSVRC